MLCHFPHSREQSSSFAPASSRTCPAARGGHSLPMWTGVCGAHSLPAELVSTLTGGHRSPHSLCSRAMASAGLSGSAGGPEEMMTGQGGVGEEGHGGEAGRDDSQYYLKSRKVRERCHCVALVLWVLSCLLFSIWILSSMSSQAVEMRRDELASMCEERARILEDLVQVSMDHLQTLSMVFSNAHHSMYPSGIEEHMRFARYAAERTAFRRLAYVERASDVEQQLLEEHQKWIIMIIRCSKMMNSTKRSLPKECPTITLSEDVFMNAISLNNLNLSVTEDGRKNVLRARQTGKVVLTSPFKLFNHGAIGVLLMYAVYKSELRPNATEQERIWSTIGYMGGVFEIEAHVDELLQKLAGKKSIMVNIYDTTNESLLTMYGSNEDTAGSGICHISILNFGDPSRKHEMHCRFKQRTPWPWMAIASSIATLVVSLHVGYTLFLITDKRIAEVKDGCNKETDMKQMPLKDGNERIGHDGELMAAGAIQATDERLLKSELLDGYFSQPFKRRDQSYSDYAYFFQKKSSGSSVLSRLPNHPDLQELVEVKELNLLSQMQEGLQTRFKFIRKAIMKLTSCSIHRLPSGFDYFNKKVRHTSLLALLLCIIVTCVFLWPFNHRIGLKREGGNMILNNFESRKYQEATTTVIQNGTVMPYLLPAHKARIMTVRLGPWIAILSVIMLVLGTAVGLLLWCKCNHGKRVQQKELELLGGMKGPRGFELHELAAATSNFADENKLGRGGFGPVYKGYLKDQDLDVAIKVLSEKQSSQEQSEQGLREFKAEVKVMTQLRHRNIVKLVGWCDNNKRLLLVYELLAQGSLDKHLYNQERILSWQQRFRIVLDIGSGLLYLHRDCEKCIVHGDIKPANVMLDVSHNAKLGDFGLARLVEHGGEPKTTQVVAGTLGYIDPEFINNRWPRTESDVYSFGIVLLEIACGKRPASRQPNGASSLLAWVHNLYSQGMTLDAADERLNGEFDPQQMERVIVTGLWCAHQDPIQRPSIVEAMDVLRSVGAELPVLGALHDSRHILSMEEQAFADLTAEDRPVRAVTQSRYFTSKDSSYLHAEE